jgi:hypothetical protein
MPQQIVYTDEAEDLIVKKFSEQWSLSKADTIKKIIREFKEIENVV